MDLRYYQAEAVTAAREAIKQGHHPVLQLATGTGKSLIMSEIAGSLDIRQKYTWVLARSQTLVEQNAHTFIRHTGGIPCGIICAGLGKNDRNNFTTFATVQSLISPAVNDQLPSPDLIIVDEAHMISHAKNEDSQYNRLFLKYPSVPRLGLTATPWRMDNGLIYGNDPEFFWFDRLAYEYKVSQGVYDGFLSPLVGVESEVQLELDELSAADEYVMKDVEEKEDEQFMNTVAKSLLTLAAKRNHIAVYCPTIVAATKAAGAIARISGWTTEVITGNTPKKERDVLFSRLASGDLRVLCSVDTITTGFDCPALDCLVCLRPTNCSSLWVQILGRLTRLHPSKHNGLVLDYVGNFRRLGGVDMLDSYVRQQGDSCSEPIDAVPAKRKTRTVYPGLKSLRPIDPQTGKEANEDSLVFVNVHNVTSVPITTRRNPNVPVLMITYVCTTPEGARIDATVFINTEKDNSEARLFLQNRQLAVNLPVPARKITWQVNNAKKPISAVIRKSGRYWNVISEQF